MFKKRISFWKNVFYGSAVWMGVFTPTSISPYLKVLVIGIAFASMLLAEEIIATLRKQGRPLKISNLQANIPYRVASCGPSPRIVLITEARNGNAYTEEEARLLQVEKHYFTENFEFELTRFSTADFVDLDKEKFFIERDSVVKIIPKKTVGGRIIA